MSIFLLTYALYAQSALPGQDNNASLSALAIVNSALVSDYRVFGEVKRTLTETPVEAEVTRWRQGFMDQPPAQREAAYRSLPGLKKMQLHGLDDGAKVPSLHLVFETTLALDAPILSLSYQPQFRERIGTLIKRLAELPADNDLIHLPQWQPVWSEEIWLPHDFNLASPLADLTKDFGFVQLRRTLKHQSGRLTLEMQCTLTQASATVADRAATLEALKEIPADAPLQFEARVLGAIGKENAITVMNELREQTTVPESRAWATIHRAAAFDMMAMPKLGLALLDAALDMTPNETSLLRARVMLGLSLNPLPGVSRQRLITCLDKLIEQEPADVARLRLRLVQILCEGNPSQPVPSMDELKRAAILIYRGLTPDYWNDDFVRLLMKLGDYETMQQVLDNPQVALAEVDKHKLAITSLAGRRQSEELVSYLKALNPDKAKLMLFQIYEVLSAHCHIEPLRVMADNAPELFQPQRLTEIESAVQESSLPFDESPAGIYRQWLRAAGLRDMRAIDQLVLPESAAMDKAFFETTLAAELDMPTWPFGIGELQFHGNPDTGYGLQVGNFLYFFAGSQDGYRLVTMDNAVHLAGHYILRLIERGQLEGAFQWLDWFYPYGERRLNSLVISTIWSSKTTRTKETAMLAAAVLAMTGPGREQVRAYVRSAFEAARGPIRNELALTMLATETDVDNYLKHADFTPEPPLREIDVCLGYWMCFYQGKCQALEGICASMAQDKTCALMLASAKGGYTELLTHIQVLEKEGPISPQYGGLILNLVLLEKNVPELPIAYLPERGPVLLPYYAERGMINELLLALSQSEYSNPTHEAYLLGRVAEAFGEPMVARRFYTEGKPPSLLEVLLDPTANLTKRHLDRLGAP